MSSAHVNTPIDALTRSVVACVSAREMPMSPSDRSVIAFKTSAPSLAGTVERSCAARAAAPDGRAVEMARRSGGQRQVHAGRELRARDRQAFAVVPAGRARRRPGFFLHPFFRRGDRCPDRRGCAAAVFRRGSRRRGSIRRTLCRGAAPPAHLADLGRLRQRAPTGRSVAARRPGAHRGGIGHDTRDAVRVRGGRTAAVFRRRLVPATGAVQRSRACLRFAGMPSHGGSASRARRGWRGAGRAYRRPRRSAGARVRISARHAARIAVGGGGRRPDPPAPARQAAAKDARDAPGAAQAHRLRAPAHDGACERARRRRRRARAR